MWEIHFAYYYDFLIVYFFCKEKCKILVCTLKMFRSVHLSFTDFNFSFLLFCLGWWIVVTGPLHRALAFSAPVSHAEASPQSKWAIPGNTIIQMCPQKIINRWMLHKSETTINNTKWIQLLKDKKFKTFLVSK